MPVGSELNEGLGRSETCVCRYSAGWFVLRKKAVGKVRVELWARYEVGLARNKKLNSENDKTE